MKTIVPGPCVGNIYIPPSKSDAQRALLAASLFGTETRLYNVGNSADEQAMRRCCEALGAQIIDSDSRFLTVKATAEIPDNRELDCGESGLCTRLLAGTLVLSGKRFTLNGHGSLKQREFPEIRSFVSQFMGPGFESRRDHIPLTIDALNISGNISADGSTGSQFVSGLLTGMCLNGNINELEVTKLTSIPYVRMTLATLREFGFDFQEHEMRHFTLRDTGHRTSSYNVAADWSSASCWLVAAALQEKPGELMISNLDSSSPQADKKILEALLLAGCRVMVSDSGIAVDGSVRKPFSFDATHCPDLFPALAVLAALTEGTSEINGVQRLRNKESDRAKAICEEWSKAGIRVEVDEDRMLIHGDRSVKASAFDAHNDHRMAMACAILASFANAPSTIGGAGSVAKSYPEFWEHFAKVHRA